MIHKFMISCARRRGKGKDEKSCLKIHHAAEEFFIKFLCVVMCLFIEFFSRDFVNDEQVDATRHSQTSKEKDFW